MSRRALRRVWGGGISCICVWALIGWLLIDYQTVKFVGEVHYAKGETWQFVADVCPSLGRA